MTAQREDVLSVRDLTIELPARSERRHAIQKLDLRVRRGEVTAVVGESGSGKSVTALAIMGLLPARELSVVGGSVELNGEDLLKATPERLRTLRGRGMAMIFQEPMTALHPSFTIGQQVAEMFDIHQRLAGRARREKVVELLESVKLPDPGRIVARYPHQLSGGQRQRAMIAMALALEPSLLIADEPTTALDVTTQAQILRLIAELQVRRNIGVLLITHDLGVVADVAHHVVVLQKGERVEQGPVADVLTRPRHAYTRQLLAAVPTLDAKASTIAAQAPVALAARNVSKTFAAGRFWKAKSEVHALRPTSLQVKRGEVLGVVGESGSGKTTLARCLARLLAATGGAIDLDGVDIARMPERAFRSHRPRIQMVFQDPNRSLNPRRTVGQSMVEGPMNYGTASAAAWKDAEALMETIGLEKQALNRYPHQFSGGQRQRICIARALALRPKVLIADEAVSALDVSVQAQILELLDSVRRRYELAMVFVTHDLRVTARICQRVVVMQRGEIVEEGETARIFSAPAHPYTRSLLEAAAGSGMPLWRPQGRD